MILSTCNVGDRLPDASALVPLLIDEPTSAACGQLWDAADTVVCTRLCYIEAVAAVAMAQRIGRISAREARDGRAILDQRWSAVDIVELGHEVMVEAARLAVLLGLRGYDATHCAAAVAANGVDSVAASGGKALLAAWQAEGIAVRDTAGR